MRRAALPPDIHFPMRKLSLALVGMLALPLALDAQAGPTPSFQPTRVAVREYNFALADFDGGSATGIDGPLPSDHCDGRKWGGV